MISLNWVRKSIAYPIAIMILISTSIVPSAFAAEDTDTTNPNVIYHEPPKGFNPVNATDVELQLYNFPPRPTDEKELKHWKEIVGTKWVAPKFKKGSRTHSNKKVTPQAFTESMYNWGGIEADIPSTRAMGEWQQPTITADASHRPSYLRMDPWLIII